MVAELGVLQRMARGGQRVERADHEIPLHLPTRLADDALTTGHGVRGADDQIGTAAVEGVPTAVVHLKIDREGGGGKLLFEIADKRH